MVTRHVPKADATDAGGEGVGGLDADRDWVVIGDEDVTRFGEDVGLKSMGQKYGEARVSMDGQQQSSGIYRNTYRRTAAVPCHLVAVDPVQSSFAIRKRHHPPFEKVFELYLAP